MGSNNVQAALQMADNAARQVTSSYREWTAFLATAGRFYKYPFPEQLMIYTQRPEATACAEWDFWNQRMRRYIRRGSRGIALIDNSRGKPTLRYVFDVADTDQKDEKGLNPNLWQYREEHHDAVTAALEEHFEVSGADGLTDQLGQIAAQLAGEYWTDHQYDLLHIVDGSFLEEYDELNIEMAFRSAATVSIAYTLMSRCGLEPENYFQHEDFLSIFDFNTRNAVTALGMAVSQSSEQVLRQIERTVKQYERTKGAERSTEHEERADLHPGGGLPVSQHGPAGAAGPGPGQVREDASAVLEGTPPGAVGDHGNGRDPVQPLSGDRGRGQQPSGGHDAPDGEGGGGHGAAESPRPDEVGGPDEQLQGPGGGDYFVGADLQLSFMPPVIPSQREQLETIQEAESADAPSAFSVPQAEEAPAGPAPMPTSMSFRENYDAIKLAHPGDIVLYQLGDFYEMFGPDARVASFELDLMLTQRNFPDTGRVAMCGIPGHKLDEYVQKLRDRHDVTVSSLGPDGARHTVSYLSVAHEARNAREAEAQALEETAPVHVPGASPPIPAPAPAREATQEDIDAALQAWNGDVDSKRRVQQYMTAHAREKDTAAWLRREYGGDLPAFPVKLPDTGQYQHLPWPKVQRRIAQLVKEDRFFTEAELDNFADVDTAAVREQLEQGEDQPSPFVEQVMADVEQITASQDIPAPEQEPMPSPAPTVRQIYEQYKPILKEFVLTDGPYQNACQNSDRENAVIEGHAAVTRAAEAIRDPDFMRLYFDMSGFRNRLHREIIDETYPVLSQPQQEQAEVPDLSGQPAASEGDAVPEFTGAADLPPHDPLAPPYRVGDTVYLDKTAFEITDIGVSEVQLRDPALPIPLLRAESKENFERLLRLDPRNNHLLLYLPADLGSVNDDIREVLTKHLLTERDKGYISGWIRSGENNRGLVMRLSEALASRDGTVTLETGDIADYFASTTSLGVDIQDKFNTRLSMSWDEIAPVLRALWLQELDGFTHEPVQREPVNLEGKLSYQEGDKVAFAYGDHDVSGTIEYIGDLGVRIHTGPYAWSHQLVEKDFFEDAVRHDERNVHLFTPEVPEQAVPEAPAPPPQETAPGTATLYPGDKNGLPYDIIVETLHVDEPEQAQPEAVPAAGNFHITDDHLGEGGPKVKYRMNVEAIRTLKQIEAEGRSATQAEQEILSRYVGWGGIPDAFDPDKAAWSAEYQELKSLLSEEEYKSARASTLNAHYTSPTVIKAIYEAVENMGFRSGNILEPACGVGNFFGLLPEAMASSKLYGVELDSITGRIAQQLYPQANIAVRGFEKTNYPGDFFDLAVGNVPFGNYPVNDPAYNKLHFSIHNYFAAKMLDKVRPGGIVAFVTSRYTLDSKNPDTRRYLAQRAELLGAVRLPNNAFKANAGTEVVCDILFFQKRDHLIDIVPDWVHLGETPDGFAVNRYFLDHPEMVLGYPTSENTQYGHQDYTVAPVPGADLAQQLQEAVSRIHGQITEPELPDLGEEPETADSIPADPDVTNYSFTVVDGEVYFRENSIMVKPQLDNTTLERIMGMVELRDCVRRLIDLQMGDSGAEAIQQEQQELNRLYDNFTARYGLINSRGNRLAFETDDSYHLLSSLEVLDEDGRMERKADMFTKRTIQQHIAVTSVDTASEALAVSIAEKAKVDMPYMAQLSGKTEEELERELTGVIFRDIRCEGNPDRTDWSAVDLNSFPLVPADEYLSGNVRRKLHMARAMYEALPADQGQRVRHNVTALEAAQPKDLEASEIEVRLGATWIDKKYIQQFMYELFKTPYYLKKDIHVNFSTFTSQWSVSGKGKVQDSDITANTTYGTERANAYRILEDTLNLRDVRVYDTIVDPDGRERRVLNAKETTLAQQRQQAIKDAFRDWIWKDPQRRQALVRQYNELFNSIRPREYDGQHITFGGINPEIELREHQRGAIAHVLYGGNTLLAHEVGAGKTFEMAAAAMEAKRLGLCQKSLFSVPNHLIEQWAGEFLRLYPSAKILVASQKDFEARNRKKFCARIATGDYDAIIMGHSQFERLPVSYARRERLLQEQILEIEQGIEELEADGAEKFSVKQLERTKRGLEARLEKLHNTPKDDVVTFEQLGVDRLFIDEAHAYKNLFLYTKMRNVAGLSTSDAQKSSDMLLKCRFMDEITGGKGVIFATGTPVSNSMTELFTMQRYLQQDLLEKGFVDAQGKRHSLTHFDSWASIFGETVTSVELAPEGTGYRARTRFARFFNLPELMAMFKETADIKTADQLHLPTPEVEYHVEKAQPSEIQKDLVQQLSQRAALVHSGQVNPKIDNMLKITHDGRKLGLDQRIVNPNFPDNPDSKLNMCVENVVRIWQDGQAGKLTQLVFCDLSTPKARAAKQRDKSAQAAGDRTASGTDLHALGNLLEDVEPDPPFSVYEDIRDKLIEKGIPPDQIAFIHDANTEARKKALFSKVRSGQVRVLLGSTFKMGAGTNVQDRLVALHDLDCPWRPGDLEQRKGRIVRQGNKNTKVHVYRYVTEGTFDSYLWVRHAVA